MSSCRGEGSCELLYSIYLYLDLWTPRSMNERGFSIVCPLSVYVHCSLSLTHISLAFSQCLHSAVCPLSVVCVHSLYMSTVHFHSHTIFHSQSMLSLCWPIHVCPLSVCECPLSVVCVHCQCCVSTVCCVCPLSVLCVHSL